MRTLSGPGYAVHLGSCMMIRINIMKQILTTHTTVNSRNSMNIALVIEPSTTVPATSPSMESNPVIVVRRPRMKTCCFAARVPFLDRPYRLQMVFSSFEVSSMKPSSSGPYCAILPIKSALSSSLRSLATRLSFFRLTPCRLSS